MQFLQKYFIDPIYQGTGYNVINTIVYGLLLGAGIIFCYKLLEKLKVKIDDGLFLALLPFITLGALLRALEDALLLPKSALFITPGIFLTIFALAAAALIISLSLRKEYHKTMFMAGFLLLIYPLFLLSRNIYTFKPLLYIAALFAISCMLVFASLRSFPWLNEKWICAAFAAHMLDASATVVGVEFFGYWEEHVFEGMLIEKLGTAFVLFPLKIIVLLAVVFVIQRVLDKNAAKFWYFALFILGFAPGLRDALKIMLLG